MATRIELRRGTAAAWATANPTLHAGEAGVALDVPARLKIGDGLTAWADLPYLGLPSGAGVLVSDGDDRVFRALAAGDIPALPYAPVDLTGIVMDGDIVSLAGSKITGTVALAMLAASATVLATPRTIAGVAFNGSANIAIPSTGLSDTANLVRVDGAYANPAWIASLAWAKLTDTPTLGDSAALNVGTAAGTVAAGNHLHTGVYEPAFGTLGVAKGGTGLASFAVGDLMYASGVTALSKLAGVATGSVLVSGGVGVAPAWSTTPTLTGLSLSVPASSNPIRLIPSGNGAVGSFNWTSGVAANPGNPLRGDHVMTLGYNNNGSGGRLDATEPAFEFRVEDYYNPSGTAAYLEAHWQYYDALGATFRPIALRIDRSNGGYLLGASMALKAADLSYLGMNDTQYVKFSAAAVQLLNSTILTNEVNNLTWLRQFNAAGNGYISLARVNASDVTVLGGAAGIQTIGASSAAFFQTANFCAGANADNAGSVIRVGPDGVSMAAKLYGGRWSSTNRGARLVGVTSGGGETTYVQVNGEGSQIELIAGDIKWGKALVALGGGAAPTLGTIGGSGPTTAAQNSWMRVLDSTGAAFWVPVWK